VIVSPDIGGVKRARSFAQQLNAPLAIIDKHRFKPNEMQAMNIIGDIQGRDCIIIDDIIDTANTICSAAALLKQKGATNVTAFVTHPVLSGTAVDTIRASLLDELVVTDTIPLSPAALACSNIRVLSVAPMLSNAIETIHREF
jgi:ribose-phosphate pyrophosphokinase